jgi:hypothetical protein
MTNLKSRLKKLEKIKNEKEGSFIITNDLELQSQRYRGLAHEPFISYVNGVKIIHRLSGQDIEHLR